MSKAKIEAGVGEGREKEGVDLTAQLHADFFFPQNYKFISKN